MKNKKDTTLSEDNRLYTNLPYQVVGEINNHNQHYWIVCLDDLLIEKNLDTSKNSHNQTKLDETALEIGQFQIKGQSFAILEVSSSSQNIAQDIATLLTERELQIATLVALGRANKQIANQLRISEWTVSTYIRRIFAKLQVDSRAAMVYRCASLIQRLRGLETSGM